MFKKKKLGEAGITLIAKNCEISGDVYFDDQLQINGVVKGNIYAQAGSRALVTVSQKGQVHGEIRVPNVIVNGNVVGDIRSDNHIELAAKAEVKGNIYYNLIEMAVGAKVNGGLRHTSNVADDLAAKREAKAAETVPGPTVS